MKIARQLKDNNIAEYLLYMWQLEDTLRAYGCATSMSAALTFQTVNANRKLSGWLISAR